MDLEIRAINPGSICEGCLSLDRNLIAIYEDDYRRFYNDILGSLENIHHPLYLCWECRSMIRRCLRFKLQVRTAREVLIRFMLHQTTQLTSLSRLKSSNTKQVTHIIPQPNTHIQQCTSQNLSPVVSNDIQSRISKLELCNVSTNTESPLPSNTIEPIHISSNHFTPQYKITKDKELRNSTPSIIVESKNVSTNTEWPFSLNNIQPKNISSQNESSKNIKTQITSINNKTSQDIATSHVSPQNTDELPKPSNPLNESQPLAFIKVENEDELGFNNDMICEGFYVDDVGHDEDGASNDDKDLKAVLKTDPFLYDFPTKKKKSKSKKKSRRKNKRSDDFDDSDDEPLKLKKCKENKSLGEYKPRGRSKNKEDGATKLDRRKHPAPKAEKPAGVVNNPRVSRKLQQLNVASGQLEMVVLSWEEVEAERQRALNSVVFTRHEYRCYDCVLGFNHKFKLENHMKKHDASSGEVSCNVCRVRCRDTHALAAHRRRHRVRWRCCACGETASRAAVAADHHARAHGAPPPTHVCTTCGHRETTLGKLRNHIKNHAERQKCELCGKTFRDRTSLRTHLFIHKGEKEYACPRCEKRFLFKKAMEVHMVTHDAPAQLYCYDCDMNFKNRMSYYQHMKYNLKHIDPAKLKYACQLCDKKFVKATRLEEHNMAVHLKATPIQCTVLGCNFACSSRPVLRTHVRMVHRNARALRNHVCDTCGKAYTTKKTLEGHMRTHTGERPFACALCAATFGYEAALYNHNKLVHLKAKTGRGRAQQSAAPAALTVPIAPAGPSTSWELALHNMTQANTQQTDNIS